jgi:hypothetical protein
VFSFVHAVGYDTGFELGIATAMLDTGTFGAVYAPASFVRSAPVPIALLPPLLLLLLWLIHVSRGLL